MSIVSVDVPASVEAHRDRYAEYILEFIIVSVFSTLFW